MGKRMYRPVSTQIRAYLKLIVFAAMPGSGTELGSDCW